MSTVINGNKYFFDGEKLFSYSTHVATLKNGVLVELGKWSSTTSRHVTTVANQLGVRVEKFKAS